MQRSLLVVFVFAIVALLGAGEACAHDRETSNGVTVTLHVDPDDAPLAGQPATLVIESVDTKATFSWGTCLCTLDISNSTGKSLLQGPAGARTSFTFPDVGAYQLTFAGRVQKTTKTTVKTKVRTIVKTKVKAIVHGKVTTIERKTPKTVVRTSVVTSTSWVTFSIPFALRADAAA